MLASLFWTIAGLTEQVLGDTLCAWPGPGRTRRIRCRTAGAEPVRVLLPDGPPTLTPAAARALLMSAGKPAPRLCSAVLVAQVDDAEAAIVTVAESAVRGRLVAAWPSFALICSCELLIRHVRRDQ